MITGSYKKQPLHLVLQTVVFNNQPFSLAATLTDITTPLQALLSRHLNYQVPDALLSHCVIFQSLLWFHYFLFH